MLLAVAIALVVLGGCANVQSKDYAAYLAASQSAASKAAEPVLRIRAQPGQTIEFRGVEVLEIYAPAAGNPATAIAPPAAVTSKGRE
ncbi:MAG: hypothetical protein IT518_14655 [Burkholderiales bacterium]|nr:hypothetical protein [Burkholderiales bacterium]